VRDAFEGGKAGKSQDFFIVGIDRIDGSPVTAQQILKDLTPQFTFTGTNDRNGIRMEKFVHLTPQKRS
jgi:hypothetical protein